MSAMSAIGAARRRPTPPDDDHDDDDENDDEEERDGWGRAWAKEYLCSLLYRPDDAFLNGCGTAVNGGARARRDRTSEALQLVFDHRRSSNVSSFRLAHSGKREETERRTRRR